MILPMVLLLAGAPAPAQDVFAGGDRTPSAQEDPCKTTNRLGNCRTFYYDETASDGRKNAMQQCTVFLKSCKKCDCWAMPVRKPAATAPAPKPAPQPTTKSVPSPSPRTPVNDTFSSGPGYFSEKPPPGRRIFPNEIGPGIRGAIQSGKCRTAMHNQRDLYLNCPGHIPDLVNDRLQKDPDAPDPSPSPIKLYGSVSTSDTPPDTSSDTGTGRGSRFGVGNINEADPPLLVTAKMLEGIDDCLKQHLGDDIAMLPLNYAAQRYRGLKSIMMAYGALGSVNTIVHDLQATAAPGQSLADRSYNVGRLLCEGYSLGDAMGKGGHGSDGPALDPVRPLNRPAIPRPAGPKPTPAYRDPVTKSALERGIPLEDHKALQGLAQSNGWNIVVRDSNPQAMRWVGHPDAAPKPVDVKAKTLKAPSKQQSLRMTAAQKAAEAKRAPHYGLASAHGMTSGDLSLLRLKGYTVTDPDAGYLLRTPGGKFMYSDLDLHGLYDRSGQDVWPKSKDGEAALLDKLNGSTLERMFQHGPQDNYTRRNDPSGPSFGPQAPVTLYRHDGRVLFIDSTAGLHSAYRELGIDWQSKYPLPLTNYRR